MLPAATAGDAVPDLANFLSTRIGEIAVARARSGDGSGLVQEEPRLLRNLL